MTVEALANEIGALAKEVWDSGVVDQEQRLTITYDSLPGKQWNPRGAGWVGDAHLKRSSSIKFQNETEGLPQATRETSKQFKIQSVEQSGEVEFTLKFIKNLIGGVTSFADYAYKVEDVIRTGKKNMNQSVYIGPTNLRTTINVGAAAATTATVLNTQYLWLGMMIDIYDGATLSMNNVEITNISGLTITLGTAIVAGGIDGFEVYLHEENLGTTDGKGFASLGQIADDTTDFAATFEDISRTTFSTWRGIRKDAASAVLTNDILQDAANDLMIIGGHDYMSEDFMSYVHPNSVRRYLSIVLPQKRYIDASKYDAGMEKPKMLEWNGRGLTIDPDCGKDTWFMIHHGHTGKMEVSPLGVESMLGGTTMKWKAGYTQGVVVTYYNGAIGTDKSNANLKIVSLQSL
jgi:hypothetical protein